MADCRKCKFGRVIENHTLVKCVAARGELGCIIPSFMEKSDCDYFKEKEIKKMTKELKEIMYDSSGYEYRIIKPFINTKGMIACYRQVEIRNSPDYSDVVDGDLVLINTEALYEQPPVAHIHASVNKQLENLKELRIKATDEKIQFNLLIKERLDKERDLKKNLEDLEKKIKAFKPIEGLFDFIEGKVTHYVKVHYGDVDIINREELKDEEDNYGNSCGIDKLLVLYGDSNGDLSWKLNQYSDGEGYDRTVFPCLSHKEALEVAAREIALILETAQDYALASIMIKAEAQGIEVAESYVKRRYDYQQKCLQGIIELKVKDLSDAQDNLLKFEEDFKVNRLLGEGEEKVRFNG